ncbi:transposase [Petroclostridium sp. X23]|uniref:transposase n=1 Tax=Petroclostridium sp. X23 TaxID=3045146 RepID=UPI0024AE06FB|nr:transposase [Petroclostridium sp. X23]WHH61755.1 transposase [Petroclostridium sp. X23]
MYRLRWQIELFFKWIKQHLKIKHFLWYQLQCSFKSDLYSTNSVLPFKINVHTGWN